MTSASQWNVNINKIWAEAVDPLFFCKTNSPSSFRFWFKYHWLRDPSHCLHDPVVFFSITVFTIWSHLRVYLFSILYSIKNIKILSFIRQWPFLSFAWHCFLCLAHWHAHSIAQEIFVKYMNKVEIRNIQPSLTLQDLLQIWQTSFSQSFIHPSTHPVTNIFSNFHWALPMSQALS